MSEKTSLQYRLEDIAAAYSEAFNDAWNLSRGLDADDELIQEAWLKSCYGGE